MAGQQSAATTAAIAAARAAKSKKIKEVRATQKATAAATKYSNELAKKQEQAVTRYLDAGTVNTEEGIQAAKDSAKARLDARLAATPKSTKEIALPSAVKAGDRKGEIEGRPTAASEVTPTGAVKDIDTVTEEVAQTAEEAAAATEEVTLSAEELSALSGLQGYATEATPLMADFLTSRSEFIESFGDNSEALKSYIVAAEQEIGKPIDTTNQQLQSALTTAFAEGKSADEIKAILQGYQIPQAAAPSVVPAKEMSEDLSVLYNQVAQSGNLDPALLASAVDQYNKGIISESDLTDYLTKFKPDATASIVEENAVNTGLVTPAEEPVSASPAVTTLDYLSGFSNSSFSDFSSSLSEVLGGDTSALTSTLSTTSSAALNQMMLANLSLEQTYDIKDKLDSMYSNMATRAAEIYESAIANVSTATEEIDNIISGTSDVATTLEALSVRVAQQSMELGLTSLEAREAYLQADYEATYSQLLEQNTRLESYMKAKLNYMGAQDSSAGLTMMASAIDNAQQRLMVYQTQFSSQMIELEVQKTALLSDYYNSVQEQLISLDDKKSSALSTYYDTLDEIEANTIASEQEMNTQILTTLSNMVGNVYQIEQDQKQWEYQLATDAYNRALQAAEIANEVEAQAKSEASAKFESLLGLYAGKTYSQLTPEVRSQFEDILATLGYPSTFASDSLQAIIDAGPERDWDIQYITDSSGRVSQVLFDKNTGETIVQGLGAIGKGSGGSGGGGVGSGVKSNALGFDPSSSALYTEIYNYAQTNGIPVIQAIDELGFGTSFSDRETLTNETYNFIDAYASLPENVAKSSLLSAFGETESQSLWEVITSAKSELK